MSESIFVTIIVGIFSALLTYFITTIVNKGAIKKAMEEVIRQHEVMYHKDEMPSFVKKAVDEHKSSCAGAQDIKHIKKMVLAIYIKNGGDIKEFEL